MLSESSSSSSGNFRSKYCSFFSCKKLKNKILKKYADVFKDKLEKTDRVNIPPVKLQIDESRKIPPVHINKPFDVSYHLRKPAKEEFREMVNAGIIVPNNEPSDWCSQAFPRMKPGSDPPDVAG